MVLTTNEQVATDTLAISMPGHEPKVFKMGEPNWQPFKAGAKLFRFELPPDYALHPDVRFNLDSVSVRFAETGLWCDGKPVVESLRKLIGFIENAVIKRLSPHVISGFILAPQGETRFVSR